MSNITVTLGLTPVEMWVEMVVFYVLLCGCMSTVGNGLICVGIVRTKNLHKRFYVIMFSLSVCRGMLCLQYLIVGAYRILRTLDLVPTVLPRLNCHSIHFWLMVGFTTEMSLMLILVLERAMALVFALRYRVLTVRQAVFICSGVFVATILVKLPFSYADVDLNESIPCINSYSAANDMFDVYSQNIDLVLLLLTVGAYGALIVYLRYHSSKAADNQTATIAYLQHKRHVKLMTVLRNMLLVHSTSVLMPKVLRSVAGIYHSDVTVESNRLVAYAGLFTTIDLTLSNVVSLFFHEEMRRACLPCRCPTSVEPLEFTDVRLHAPRNLLRVENDPPSQERFGQNIQLISV